MKRFLQVLFTAKTARLVLDYLKVLAWPLVMLVALVTFSTELKGLLGRITSGTVSPTGVTFATGGTGNPSATPPVSPEKPLRPDVWYNIRIKPASGPGCAERATMALTRSGFPPNQIGDNIYGYAGEKIVGAVWCGAPNNSVLITVAGGPVEDLKTKLSQLENAFLNAGS